VLKYCSKWLSVKCKLNIYNLLTITFFVAFSERKYLKLFIPNTPCRSERAETRDKKARFK